MPCPALARPLPHPHACPTTPHLSACSVGGLSPNQVVQLSNGGMALVLEVDEQRVVLDANSALAGKSLVFELELVDIQRGR